MDPRSGTSIDCNYKETVLEGYDTGNSLQDRVYSDSDESNYKLSNDDDDTHLRTE